MLDEIVADAQASMDKALEAFGRDLTKLRTGRANLQMLDGIRVDDDGARVTGGLPGGVSVLRRGKKTLAGVFLGPRESA